jgi:hypothetical protein
MAKPKRSTKKKTARIPAKAKRSLKPKRPVQAAPVTAAPARDEKPPIGLPDPLEAAQEAARLAQEGSLKLSRAVDTLRETLETIVVAEMDLRTQLPTTTKDLRGIAIAGLNAYAQISGQSWKKHKLVGNWAGSTGNAPVHERDM